MEIILSWNIHGVSIIILEKVRPNESCRRYRAPNNQLRWISLMFADLNRILLPPEASVVAIDFARSVEHGLIAEPHVLQDIRIFFVAVDQCLAHLQPWIVVLWLQVLDNLQFVGIHPNILPQQSMDCCLAYVKFQWSTSDGLSLILDKCGLNNFLILLTTTRTRSSGSRLVIDRSSLHELSMDGVNGSSCWLVVRTVCRMKTALNFCWWFEHFLPCRNFAPLLCC